MAENETTNESDARLRATSRRTHSLRSTLAASPRNPIIGMSCEPLSRGSFDNAMLAHGREPCEFSAFSPVPPVVERSATAPVEWRVCCTSINRECFVFAVQVIAAFSIMTVSLYQIIHEKDTSGTWHGLLGSAFGTLLPAPKLKRSKD